MDLRELGELHKQVGDLLVKAADAVSTASVAATDTLKLSISWEMDMLTLMGVST